MPSAPEKVFQVFQLLTWDFLKPHLHKYRQVFHSKIPIDQVFITIRNTWNTFSEAYTPHARCTCVREGVPPRRRTFFRNRCPRTPRPAAYMSHGEPDRHTTRRIKVRDSESGTCYQWGMSAGNKPGRRSYGPRATRTVRYPAEYDEIFIHRAEESGIPLSSWLALAVSQQAGLDVPEYVRDELEEAQRKQSLKSTEQELDMPRSA